MNGIARLEALLQRAGGSRRLHAWTLCAIAAVASLGLFYDLGEAPISRTSELRCHDAAQTMLESGDWLVPMLDGQPRLQKPPLCYWAAAASGALAGGSSLGTARLPAALAALGLLAVVYSWGRARGGLPTGILAATCLLLTMQYWTLGRRGDAEMPLAFFASSALFAFDLIYWEKRRDLLSWFFVAVLLAFLAKATVALLVIGLPIALQLASDRSLGRIVHRDVVVRGALCALGCVAWYGAILLWVPGARAALLESALLPLGLAESVESSVHVRPIWYFVPQLVSAAAPAVLLAPLVPWHLARRRKSADASRLRFPALGFAALFIAITLIPMKQKHYLLPLLPLLALSSAQALRAAYGEHRDLLERGGRWVGWILAVGAPAAALGVALHAVVVSERAVAMAGLDVLLLGAGVLGFLASRRGSLRVVGLSVVVATSVVVGVRVSSFEPVRLSFQLAEDRAEPPPHAERWTRIFERYPALRAVYGANDWNGAEESQTTH